uniref:Leucine-rich repeat-containing N-terminal plant-type domain-containing protein n=1 Tax=Opuntia streptacantha TaxID=393608 RepID=A0A7C9EQ20_OPUST
MVEQLTFKDSLCDPDRMGWNGDPCGPISWDAWEGVTCRTNKDGNALVIFQIDLGSQGLEVFVSDHISHLTNLASLQVLDILFDSFVPTIVNAMVILDTTACTLARLHVR